MTNGLIDTAAATARPRQRHFYGVAVAVVVSNFDLTGQARVQIKLPWMPGFEPWARVVVPLSGPSRGIFVIPQVDDEVLVAFHHGDLREPYVLGGVWNGQDRPPAQAPIDAMNKILIKTPKGHEIEIDDLQQKITITTLTRQSVVVDPQKIELSTSGGTAKATLQTTGMVTLEGKVSLTLKAPKISIEGTTIDIKSNASTTINGGGQCEVKAGIVRIN
jgi:uncharacterized protein involved in type VI secretion and phage assembly